MFRTRVGDKYEESVAYSDTLDFIEDQDGKDGLWKFERILNHKYVKPSDPDYRGCSVDVLLEWCLGEKTWEPIKALQYGEGVLDEDHITLALYVGEKGLLDTKDGSILYSRSFTTMGRCACDNYDRHNYTHNVHVLSMCGFQVPCEHAEAMRLDEENGNKSWYEAEQKELAQFNEYNTFEGYKPEGHKTINVHLVYAVIYLMLLLLFWVILQCGSFHI